MALGFELTTSVSPPTTRPWPGFPHKNRSFYLDIIAAVLLRCAEVQNLWHLAPRWVRSVEAQRARREREGRPIRAFDRRGATVPVACPSAMVAESKAILDVRADCHRLLELEFGDVVDTVVRGVTAVCDFKRVPALGLTSWVLRSVEIQLTIVWIYFEGFRMLSCLQCDQIGRFLKARGNKVWY